MSIAKNKLVLQQLAPRINRMVLIGLFDLVIGILTIMIGLSAPTVLITFYGYGILTIFGFLIGIFAIVAGILAILSGIGIPIAIIAEVFPPITSLKTMQLFAGIKGALCLISLVLLFFGSGCTIVTLIYYLGLMLVDFSLAYYGGEIIRLILRIIPAPLRF